MSDSLIHATAGGAGGVLAMTLTYPLVFFSTRAAVETKKSDKSFAETVAEIIKNEGITSMYAGLTSSLLGIAVTNFVYYGFYEKSKDVILRSRPGKGLGTAEAMIAGMVAGSATTIISNPIWVVQTTQAVQTSSKEKLPTSSNPKPKKLSLVEAVKAIIEKDGVKALWRGLGPALILVINPVIQYTVFEQLKNKLVQARTSHLRSIGSAAAAVLSDTDYFLLGAISKLVATSLTYPYIVIKSRMQAGHEAALKYKSAWGGIMAVLKNEGLAGLYRGIESKLVHSVLTAAILFASQRRIYEITKTALTVTAPKN